VFRVQAEFEAGTKAVCDGDGFTILAAPDQVAAGIRELICCRTGRFRGPLNSHGRIPAKSAQQTIYPSEDSRMNCNSFSLDAGSFIVSNRIC
jgi:hypothetical protein